MASIPQEKPLVPPRDHEPVGLKRSGHADAESEPINEPMDIVPEHSQGTSQPTQTHIPLLLSSESKRLAPLIMGLNNTATLNALFANNGEDLTSDIEYSSDWWNPSPEIENLSNEKWQLEVRIELQKLNAYLSGGFKRDKCTTGRLESLLNDRRDWRRDKEFALEELCELLGQIPQFKDALTQNTEVEDECINILPLMVDLDLPDPSRNSVQDALDSIFWQTVMECQDSFKEEEVPILNELNNLLVVQCVGSINLSRELWPERYKRDSLPIIEESWKKKHELVAALSKGERETKSLQFHNGQLILPKIEKTLEALREFGDQSALKELEENFQKLQLETNKAITHLDETRQSIDSQQRTRVVPINPMTLTPWILKAVMWLDEYYNPVSAYLQEDKRTWVLTQDSNQETISWEDIVEEVGSDDEYVAVYECNNARSHHSHEKVDSGDHISFAPSIKKFIEQDNEALARSHTEDQHSIVDKSQEPVSKMLKNTDSLPSTAGKPTSSAGTATFSDDEVSSLSSSD